MSLELLLVLVVGGIAGVVVLVHLIGWSRSSGLTAISARTQFEWDNPNSPVRKVVLGTNRRSALLELADGSIGIIGVMGDGFVTRILDAGIVAAVSRNGGELTVRLNDFTDPDFRVAFGKEVDAADWANRLEAERHEAA